MELDLQPIKLEGVSEERPLIIAGREVSKESAWKDCPGSRKSRKKPACM